MQRNARVLVYHRLLSVAHELMTTDEHPGHWMLFLHGLLGRRVNWRSFARSYIARRPSWGAVLVDLREHGDSQGLPGPARSRRLERISSSSRNRWSRRTVGVLEGCSGTASAARLRSSVRADSERSGRESTSCGSSMHRSVLAWTARLDDRPRVRRRSPGSHPEFESRSAFIDAVIAAGVARSVAQWLEDVTWSRTREDGGLRSSSRPSARCWGLQARRFWRLVDAEADAGTRVSMVLGDCSEAVFGDELEQARARSARSGAIECTRWQTPVIGCRSTTRRACSTC